MSRSLDGYLILGWEVELEDMDNYDLYEGLTEEAGKRVDEILGETWTERFQCDPITFKSLYYDCDYVYLGLVLMTDYSDTFSPKEYGEFLASNADLLTKTAKDLYTTIMGKEPASDPMLMVVGTEG